MPMETDELNQDAVLWVIEGIDDYSRPRIGDPTALAVRWEHKTAENLTPFSQDQEIVAFVAVDRDIAVGSIIWEGALGDLPGTPTPLYQVVSLKKIPDVKGEEVRRTLALIRYTNTLPS